MVMKKTRTKSLIPPHGQRFCTNCGSQVAIYHKKRLSTSSVFCNQACRFAYMRKNSNNSFCAFCGKPMYVKPSHKSNNHGNCCGKKCLGKLRSIIYKNDNNPNYKHTLDLSCIYNMTHEGAYILGFIWADGHLEPNSVILSQDEQLSGDLLRSISLILFNEDITTPKSSSKTMRQLSINNKDFVSYLVNDLGGIVVGKKSNVISVPNIPEEFVWSFICGYFDGDGSFNYNYRYPQIQISSNSSEMLQFVANVWGVNYTGLKSICASGTKALDICGNMYKDVRLCHEKKYNYFVSILNYEPLNPHQEKGYIDIFRVRKLDKTAVLPYKKHVTDSGYDISVVEFEDLGNNIFMCNTKLAVEPPPGYYFDVVGRSSLPKDNFHFLGGVGIIDRSYVGPIKLILQQLDSTKPLPSLPFRCAQIIPRKIEHFEFVEVSELADTNRGAGGFGSTNFIPSDLLINKDRSNLILLSTGAKVQNDK